MGIDPLQLESATVSDSRLPPAHRITLTPGQASEGLQCQSMVLQWWPRALRSCPVRCRVRRPHDQCRRPRHQIPPSTAYRIVFQTLDVWWFMNHGETYCHEHELTINKQLYL